MYIQVIYIHVNYSRNKTESKEVIKITTLALLVEKDMKCIQKLKEENKQKKLEM